MRGGLDVPRMLRAASHDVLSGLGPLPAKAWTYSPWARPRMRCRPRTPIIRPAHPFLLDVLPGKQVRFRHRGW
ncbi:hypothetical protein [Ruania alkalisoli]|uniref:hypothetical protein n=1 Tax=Ruania alkalisoli TaxID=2779775 RepID=UPI003CCCBF2F